MTKKEFDFRLVSATTGEELFKLACDVRDSDIKNKDARYEDIAEKLVYLKNVDYIDEFFKIATSLSKTLKDKLIRNKVVIKESGYNENIELVNNKYYVRNISRNKDATLDDWNKLIDRLIEMDDIEALNNVSLINGLDSSIVKRIDDYNKELQEIVNNFDPDDTYKLR